MWQPIETAPRDSRRVLITGRYPNGIKWVEESYRHPDGHFTMRRADQPTHWMPLPDPPENEE